MSISPAEFSNFPRKNLAAPSIEHVSLGMGLEQQYHLVLQ